MKIVTSHLINLSNRLSDIYFWSEKLQKDYGLNPIIKENVTGIHSILRQIYNILAPVPLGFIKNCGIKNLIIRGDMGPNKPYYPNHGYFVDDKIALNADIFHNPDSPNDFIDHRGYFLTRPQQTLLHELFHGYDAAHNNLSLKPEWLKLSGWSPVPKPGLKRIVIRDSDMPVKYGEWYYNPTSDFTRFYAKMNPWDDWADSGSFFILGLDKLPENKKTYFNNLLKY